jgi:hypothetical protein
MMHHILNGFRTHTEQVLGTCYTRLSIQHFSLFSCTNFAVRFFWVYCAQLTVNYRIKSRWLLFAPAKLEGISQTPSKWGVGGIYGIVINL